MHEKRLLGLMLASGFVTLGCGESGRHDAGAGGFAGTSGAVGSVVGSVAGSGGSATNASGGSAGTSNMAGGAVSVGGTNGGGSGRGAAAGAPPSSTGGAAGASAGGASGATSGGATSGSAGAGGSRVHSTDVTVNLDEPQQTMDGFGINDTFATAFDDNQANQLFTTESGIGLSILGIAMDTNGSAVGDNMWSDVQKAKTRGVGTFTATTWTAAAACKSNRNVNDGGFLDDDCYESWSDSLAAFPALVKSNTGVDLYGISPQHEPDFASCGSASPCNGDFPSMLFTADEMVTFANLLGPKLHALSPPVKLLGPDTQEWNHLWTNHSAAGATDPLMGAGYDYGHALFNDETAWSSVDVLATHQYDSQVAEPWPSDVPRNKPVWMTEMSGIKFWPEQGPSDDIQNGIVVAGWIHDAIVNGPASAWMYFWRSAENTDDNEGLFLKSGSVTKRFYTLGNFSRFIRPGYTRVSVTGSIPANVLLSGYQGPDGTLVVVAINKGDSAVTLPIFVAGGAAPSAFTPNATTATDDLAVKTSVPVSGGAFVATLASLTVTTFVGKP